MNRGRVSLAGTHARARGGPWRTRLLLEAHAYLALVRHLLRRLALRLLCAPAHRLLAAKMALDALQDVL